MKNIVFKSCCFDFEEGYTLTIYENNGIFSIEIIGHNVMFGDYNNISEITEYEAIKIMIKEEKNEDKEYEEMQKASKI